MNPFSGLAIVCAAGFLAPLLLGLAPRLRLPAIVLEILTGILIGPHGLGWVTPDASIRTLSILGIGFLLFLSGLELDFTLLKGRRLNVALLAFVVSVALAYAIALGLRAAGIVESALLVAICWSATGLGLVAPVLKDAGEGSTEFGQLIIGAATISDFGTVLLLSMFFSRESSSAATQLVLMGGFVVLSLVVVVAMQTAKRWGHLGTTLRRLQDSTAQIRIRGAFLFLVTFAALATRLGLEVILGAFVAGALIAVFDRDYASTHPKFHEKLEAIGFGVFIPIFFVTSGLTFDVSALFTNTGTMLRVPIFLLALLVARGLPALMYRPLIGRSRVMIAAVLQATNLPFIVATTTIGVELHQLTPPNAAALVAAGLLSVVIFPATALVLLKRE